MAPTNMLVTMNINVSNVLGLLTHTLGFPHTLPSSSPLVEFNTHADTHADQQDCRQQQEVVAQNSFNMLFHRLHSLDNSLTTHV